MESVIRWIHAIAGAAWIGACACFVIAGLAPAHGSAEQREFAARSAARINQFAVVAAVLLLLTGVVNLTEAVAMSGGTLSGTFVFVLWAKIVLYLLMLAALGVALRAGETMQYEFRRGRPNAVPIAIRTMVGAHAATLAMGAAATVLGLWLTGS